MTSGANAVPLAFAVSVIELTVAPTPVAFCTSIVMATEKAKWDPNYQRRWGVTTRAATDLPPGHDKLIPHLSKRIYRILGLTGYARLDFRMSAKGDLYLLEANPNPQLAHGEDFADSAAADGMAYDKLLQQICTLGLQYSPHILS